MDKISYKLANKFIGKTIVEFAKEFSLDISSKFYENEFYFKPITNISLEKGYGSEIHVFVEGGFWGIYHTAPLNCFLGLRATKKEIKKWFKIKKTVEDIICCEDVTFTSGVTAGQINS